MPQNLDSGAKIGSATFVATSVGFGPQGGRGDSNPRPLGSESRVLDHWAPGGHFPWGIVPQGNHPPGRHPAGESSPRGIIPLGHTPLGSRPPRESSPWGNIPLGNRLPRESFPLGITALGNHTPKPVLCEIELCSKSWVLKVRVSVRPGYGGLEWPVTMASCHGQGL